MGLDTLINIQAEQFQRNLWIGIQSVTTGAGNVGGTTIVDTARTEAADFWNDHYSVVILSGANIGEIRQIIDHDGTDTITVDRAFTAQVAATVTYLIRRDPYSIQGANSADNLVDTSNTSYNIDGSIVERTESLLQSLQTVAGGGTGFEEDGSGATLYKTVVGYEGLTTSAGTTTTIVDTVLTAFAADHWNGGQVMMLENNSAGVVRTIVDFDGTSTLTVEPALPVASSDASAYIILPGKSADWIVGDNTANNAYDSSAVTVNSDGSVLERLEHIVVALGGTTGTTTALGLTTTAIDTARTEAADYWNGGIFVCVDGANAGLGRPIYDFDAALDTLHFEPAFPNAVASGVEYIILNRYDTARLIGDNSADNAIDSSTVAANENGSVLERLEQLQETINRGDGSVIPADRSLLDIYRKHKGNVFYVSAAGNDGTGDGSYDNPYLTIDYAVGQCTAYNDDYVYVLGGGTFDEDANTDGVQVDVENVHIIGTDEVYVQNANVSATSVFHVTVTAEIANLAITETTNTVDGISIDSANASASHIHDINFTAAMENGISMVNAAQHVTIENNLFRSITNDGIEIVSALYTRIRKNTFIGNGDNAIHISGVNGDYNFIYNNVINGAGTTTSGINVAAGDHNIITRNFVNGCTNNFVDNGTNTHMVDNDEEYTNINATEVFTKDDVNQVFATLWAADGANTFNPTIDGVARTDLETAFEALDGLISEIGGTALRGTVTTYTSATEFASTDLTGYGDDAFEGWYVCSFESDGAAPQMELPERISAYTSATGVFTHTAFDSGILATDDEVLIIHPSVYMAMLAVYEHKIHFDDTSGIAGTYYPIGTPMMPSSNAANSKTIADNLLFNKFQIKGSFTVPATMQGYYFAGDNPINISDLVGFNSQDIDGSTFQNLVISGVQAGTVGLGTQIFCIDCFAIAVSGFNGTLDRCMVSTTLGLAAGAYAQFTNCSFGVNVATTVTLGTPAKCDFYGFKGNATIAGLTGGTGVVNIWLQDGATITIDNTNTGNTINVYGNGTVTDNNGGTTVNDYTLQADIGDPSARTNLQSIEAMLGNPDAANCDLYGAIGDEYINGDGNPDVDNIRAHLRAGLVNGTGTVLPANKSLYTIIGTGYVDGGGNPDVDNIEEHLRAGLLNGTGSAVAANKSLRDYIGVSYLDGGGAFNTDSVWDDFRTIGQYLIDGTAGAEAGTVLPAGKSLYDGLIGGIDAVDRSMGKTQIIEVSVTAAANAGVTTVATVTTQPCLIKSAVIHADAAQTGDMTSCALKGGTNQVVTFIDAATAIQANLDAADKQVSWTGARRFATADTIAIDLQGTGGTAVDLTVTIEYMACVDLGYLA